MVIRGLLICISIFCIAAGIHTILSVAPVQFTIKEQNLSNLQTALYQAGAPDSRIPELALAVHKASQSTGINPYLLVALTKTESRFNYSAKSPKNYKGLLQTPWASMKWADVDILHGARILEDKLRISKGNMEHALALYKGGDNKQAHKQAKEVLVVYRFLKKSQ
jgi:soluble lytic murein transglycosylase-like protein